MSSRTLLVALVVGAVAFPMLTSANIGVGVGAGKIVMSQPLEPGLSYALPALPVLNTGDSSGTFSVSIEYLTDQQDYQPPREWFTIDPLSFTLDATQSRLVNVKLSVPTSARPGHYFAYLEARPVIAGVAGQSSVGVAAAAKLYFVVAPSNAFQAWYYKTAAFLGQYAPWPQVISIVIVATLLLTFINRFFSLNIHVRRKR